MREKISRYANCECPRCCELGRLTFPKSYSSLINLVLSAFVNLTASRRWEERESFDMGGDGGGGGGGGGVNRSRRIWGRRLG